MNSYFNFEKNNPPFLNESKLLLLAEARLEQKKVKLVAFAALLVNIMFLLGVALIATHSLPAAIGIACAWYITLLCAGLMGVVVQNYLKEN